MSVFLFFFFKAQRRKEPDSPGLKLSALSSVVKVLSVHMLPTKCAEK